MGNFSEIDDCCRKPILITVSPYLRDHLFEGKAVLPAVTSMQLLADAVSGLPEEIDDRRIAHAAFEKLLVLDPGEKSIDAYTETKKIQDGGLSIKLVTRRYFGGSGITRVIEHARVCFFPRTERPDSSCIPVFEKSRSGMTVSADSVYRELVPFGRTYQNISGSVTLNRVNAVANIFAPELPDINGSLGSPFVLDAAFHVACVWGQRYSGFIGFPIGFDSRVVITPTKSGGTYTAHLLPVKQCRGENIFDVWIYQPDSDTVFEIVAGLRMRDVTGGRKKPPQWIQTHLYTD